MQEEKSYLFDLVGKNMGSTTESHLLCQLFFRVVIFPWERISAARITVRSVRALSYLDMKEGKMEEGGGKGGERKGKRSGEAGLPWEWWYLKFAGRPLESSSSSFHDQVLVPIALQDTSSARLFPLGLSQIKSKLDTYTVDVCATASVTACPGVLLKLGSFSLFICGHHECYCCLIASLVHVRSANLLLLFRCRCKRLNKSVTLYSEILWS